MASPRTRRAAVTTTSHRHQNIALGLKTRPNSAERTAHNLRGLRSEDTTAALGRVRLMRWLGLRHIGLGGHILSGPVVVERGVAQPFAGFGEAGPQLRLRREVLEDAMAGPIVEPSQLVGVAVLVALTDRRAATLDVAVVDEHDLGAGSQHRREAAKELPAARDRHV